MSEPAPNAIKGVIEELKTFALGFVIAMAVFAQLRTPLPVPPTPPAPTPTPIPVPVPPNPNPTPTPVPPTPTPTPVVNDFFLLGKSYKQALGKAYADAWDRNFVVAPGDDLDVKFSAIKSDWNASRTAAFSAIVAPELEKLAPNRKSVDQPTADALNKSRADFTKGLRDGS